MRTIKHPERADRLESFLNELKIKNVELARRLELQTPAFISQLVNKKASITTDFAYRIANAYPKLNVNWLLHGNGTMFNDVIQENVSADFIQEPTVEYGNPLDILKMMLKEYERRLDEYGERIARLERERDRKEL